MTLRASQRPNSHRHSLLTMCGDGSLAFPRSPFLSFVLTISLSHYLSPSVLPSLPLPLFPILSLRSSVEYHPEGSSVSHLYWGAQELCTASQSSQPDWPLLHHPTPVPDSEGALRHIVAGITFIRTCCSFCKVLHRKCLKKIKCAGHTMHIFFELCIPQLTKMTSVQQDT